jgi:hypothetical protein
MSTILSKVGGEEVRQMNFPVSVTRFPYNRAVSEPWSRGDKIGVFGVVVAVILAALAVLTPEIRQSTHLDKPEHHDSAVPPLASPQTSPSLDPNPTQNVASQQSQRESSPKSQTSPSKVIRVHGDNNTTGVINGNNNIVGNNNTVQPKQEEAKASLSAGFWSQGTDPRNMPQEVTASRRTDGSVSVDIVVMNLSETAAVNGAYTIRICKACKYANEPSGLQHVQGSDDQDREVDFQRILSKSADARRIIEFFPPTFSPLETLRVEMDVSYACVNCVTETIRMWVNVQ